MSHAAPVNGHVSPIWDLPELRRAPATFRAFLRLTARNWTEGSLEVVTPDGVVVPVRGQGPGPEAQLVVKSYRFVGRVLSGGSIGFAEAYMAGEWDTPDLSVLLETLSRNFDRLRGLVGGNPLVSALHRIAHRLGPNDRAGSRRNIHAHYDLGNAFYEAWLDPTMTYSAAVFDRTDQPLNEAQTNKYRRLAQKAGIGPGDTVLEIGCGWGGFAEFAAREIDARVTGLTISQAQFDYARKRLFEQGLNEKTDVRLMDYRDMGGTFDKVVSIEMFEAVGERWWPTFFRAVRDRLKPGGLAAMQIITLRDDLFDRYRRRADFIQRYIFPGGVLPSEARLRPVVGDAGLTWRCTTRHGRDYARTLALWGQRFQEAWRDIAGQGFDQRFRRLWTYYLAYCEAGFRTGRTDVIQMGLARP